MQFLDSIGLKHLIQLIKAELSKNADKSEGSTLISKEEMLSYVYPVGSIYISASSVNPASLFGGTWEQLKDTFLLAAGDTYAAGSTGGEAEHTLTVGEMPSHNHTTVRQRWYRTETGTATGDSVYGINNKNVGSYTDISCIQNTGNDEPHNNMPPYISVYVWKRIS